MQESNEELSRWLTAHAERIENFERYLVSEGEEGLVGSPIHGWLLEELEECRRSAYSQSYLLQSGSLDKSLLSKSLEQWKYYAAISLYMTIAKCWSKDIAGSTEYPDPDIGTNVAANLANVLSRDSFLECEPDIFGMVVEYTRKHIHESLSMSSDSIINRAVLMVETERSRTLSKRKQLLPLDPGLKKDGLTDHIQYHLGPIDTPLAFPKAANSDIKLLHLKPNAPRPYHLIITHGMSNMPMQSPNLSDNSSAERIELLISLPAFWRLDPASLENDHWNWPLDLLLSCANYPFAMDTYLASGHTINLGDHTYPSGYDSVLVCLSNETPSDFDSLKYRGDEVDFFALLPLYPEELKLKLSAGQMELFRELHKNNIGTIIRTSRANVAKEWFERLYATRLDDTTVDPECSDTMRVHGHSSTGSESKPSQLDAIRSWADTAVQRILERADTELPVQNLLELAYGISKGTPVGASAFDNASQEEVYECALTAVFVLDANQTVYEWGKDKAVLRLSEQISPIRYELQEICPHLESLVFATVPFIWALDHRLAIEEATDMAARAKVELNRLHGPGSLTAELHIFEQQGYGALGERNRNSQLDSILLAIGEYRIRNDVSIEDWKVGLAGKILLDVWDVYRLNGEESAIERLAESLSYECFASRLTDVVSLVSANLAAVGLGDQELSLRIWNQAIDKVNEYLNEKRLDAAKKNKKPKPLSRHLLEVKWSLIGLQKRCFRMNRGSGFPGQNMYRISLADLNTYLTPSQYRSLVDHFGSDELLHRFVSQANTRLSGYGVSRLKGEIAGLGEEFNFAEYFEFLSQCLVGDGSAKSETFAWLACLACDLIFLLFVPVRRVSAGSIYSIATAFVEVFLYLFLLRPFIYSSQTSFGVFRLYELNDIAQSKNRWIIAVRILSLMVIGVYLLEWTKMTDFFRLPMFTFLVIPMIVACWPEAIAANLYSLRFCGLRGFFADVKKMQTTNGKPIFF